MVRVRFDQKFKKMHGIKIRTSFGSAKFYNVPIKKIV